MKKKENKTWIIMLVVVLVLIFLGGYGMMNLFNGNYSGYYGYGWLFGIIALLAAIWVIYDVLANNTRLSDGMKFLWIVFAIFFSILTAVIYYLIGRNSRTDLFDRRITRRNKR